MARNIEGRFIDDVPENYPGGVEARLERGDLPHSELPILNDETKAALAAEAKEWVDPPADAPVIKKAVAGRSVTSEGRTVPTPTTKINTGWNIEGGFIGDMPKNNSDGREAGQARADIHHSTVPTISDDAWAAIGAEAKQWVDPPAGAPVIKKAFVGTSVTSEGWTVPAATYDNDISASAWGVKETIQTRGLDIEQWNDKTVAFVEATVGKLYDRAERDFKGIATSSSADQAGRLPLENAAFMALQYIECERFVRNKDDARALIFEGALPHDFLKLLPQAENEVPFVVSSRGGDGLADAVLDAAKTDRPIAGKLIAISNKLNNIAQNAAAEIKSGALLPILRDLDFIDQRRPQGLQDYAANVALNGVRRYLKLHEEFLPKETDRKALELKPGTRIVGADNKGSKPDEGYNIA